MDAPDRPHITPQNVEIDADDSSVERTPLQSYQKHWRKSDGDGPEAADVGGRGATEATYYNLVRHNWPYRLFLMSLLVTYCGEWFTYVASIALIEHLLADADGDGDETPRRTAISILVAVRMIPNVIWSAFGGVLADSRDRRRVMMVLDVLGSTVALLYLAAYRARSVVLIYAATFVQASIAGLYEPCRSSIVPLLVPDVDFLKKATTLSELAWSAMAAVGSSLGGVAVAAFGIRACFLIDGATYLASAFLMWQVGGTWSVARESAAHMSPWEESKSMIIEGVRYLRASFFGPIVLMKVGACAVGGMSDVLNVSFSEPEGGDEASNSMRLGILFAAVGIGCFLGPLTADQLTDMKKASTMQSACVWSFGVVTLGCVGMVFFTSFAAICVFTSVRAAGVASVWVNSSLLLQKFSAPEMLGRVSSVDYALATLSEATSALVCGILQDKLGYSPQQVAFVMAAIGAAMFSIWFIYDWCGLGGASNSAKGLYQRMPEALENEPNSACAVEKPSLIQFAT